MLKRNNFIAISFVVLILNIISHNEVISQEDTSKLNYLDIPLEELLNLKVVTATKTPQPIRKAPGTIIFITGREIEEMGARTLSDIFKMTTGIQILNRRNGRDMVWIRGVTTGYNTKVLLLIDGIPQREAIIGEWSSDEELQINNIDHIEIIRGPGSELYGGNAYAGIVSVFTKQDAKITKAAVSLGNFNTQKLEFNAGGSFGASKIIVAGNFYETDGHEMDRDRKGKDTDHSDHVDVKNIHIKYLQGNFRLGLTHNDFVTDYPLYSSEREKPQYFKTTNAFTDYNFETEKFNINPKFYIFQGQVYFDYKTKDINGRLISEQIRRLKSVIGGFDCQLTYELTENNTLVAGVTVEKKNTLEFYEELIFSQGKDSIDYVLLSGDTITRAIPHYLNWLDADADESSDPGKPGTLRYAVYLQEEIKFLEDRFNLNFGCRFDKYEGFNPELSPRVSLVINVTDNLTFKSQYGKAFKPATYRQKYFISIQGKSTGNPNLEPERIATLESGLSYNLANKLLLDIVVFRSSLADFIESVNYAEYSNSKNNREISGIELGLRTAFNLNSNIIHSISVFSNYSYINANDITDTSEKAVASVAPNSANLGFTLRNKYITYYSGFNFVGKRNSSDTYHSGVKVEEYKQKDNLGSYLIWDLNLGIHNFSELPLKFYITIHNVLDTKHFNPTYDPDSYYDYTKERRNISLKLVVEL